MDTYERLIYRVIKDSFYILFLMKNSNSSFNKYLLIASVLSAGDLVRTKADKVSNNRACFSEKSFVLFLFLKNQTEVQQ